jgi:hypothetical protein
MWKATLFILLECGVAFGCTAVILGGEFYVAAVVCMVLALVLARFPTAGPLVFGACFAAALFIPAWKYTHPARATREPRESPPSKDKT